MHNVARLFANPDHITAEFAVMVRSDLSQRGLGFRLMTDLVEYARNRGLSALFGDEHVQNRRMLQLAQELGFVIAPASVDEVVRVSRDLDAEPPIN